MIGSTAFSAVSVEASTGAASVTAAVSVSVFGASLLTTGSVARGASLVMLVAVAGSVTRVSVAEAVVCC